VTIYTAGFFLPNSYCPDIICRSLVDDLEMNKAILIRFVKTPMYGRV